MARIKENVGKHWKVCTWFKGQLKLSLRHWKFLSLNFSVYGWHILLLFSKENMHKNINTLPPSFSERKFSDKMWHEVYCCAPFTSFLHYPWTVHQPKALWVWKGKASPQHHSENCLGPTRAILCRNTWELCLHSRKTIWFRNNKSYSCALGWDSLILLITP